MFLVHNERTKLTATWFNGLATALIAAGFFAPLAALFYGLTELRIGARGIVVMGTVCLGGRRVPTLDGPGPAQETAGVEMSEADVLTVFVFAYPVLVVAMALLVVWLTGWMDAREDRRQARMMRPGE